MCGSFIYGYCAFAHHPDKADALARERAYQPLPVAIVTDRSPRRIDAAGKRRFRYNAPAPDCLNNIVLADNAVAVGDKVLQQVKHLRLHLDECIPPAELAAIRVEHKIFKGIKHFCPRCSGFAVCARILAQMPGRRESNIWQGNIKACVKPKPPNAP